MISELTKALLFFLTGGILIFLAVTIGRDNFTNRLNRVTGAMLFFAGAGPIMLAMGVMIAQSSTASAPFQTSRLDNMIYLWELFFPWLLLFSWLFPLDRLRGLKYTRLRYLIFLPQIIHLLILLFYSNLGDFHDLLRAQAAEEGFTGLLAAPIAWLVSWIYLMVGFVRAYQTQIFGVINLSYVLTAVYFLESGRRHIANPRLATQTSSVLWAFRISLGLYVAALLVPDIMSMKVADQLKSSTLIIAALSGAGIIIYATIHHQFLDVRLIFRQSFAYTIASAVLVGLYILTVIQAEHILAPIFGNAAQIVSYAMIILLLFLFQPINNFLEELIRSMFIRTRTDHRNVLARFSRQVISTFDLQHLLQIITETMKTALLVERVYFILFDDSAEEYAIMPSEDFPRRIILNRQDLMLRGINLLDQPTYSGSLAGYEEGSSLAEALKERRVRMVLPMKDDKHLLGFLALTDKIAGYRYSAEDMNLLGVLSNQMVSALTNARLYLDSLERVRLQEEVSMARQIQLDLLPSKPPQHDNLEITAHSTPSRTVGGDFYDFIETNNNRIGMVIADASGKGMPAALMVAQTQAIIRNEISNGNPISNMMKNANQQMFAASSAEKYVSLFYCELDAASGRMNYSNAGHNYPVLSRADGTSELLTTGGPIIGALADMSYESASIELNPDDVLLFFTDGLSEAMNENDDEFTEERIRELVCKHRREDPQTIVDTILGEVRSFDPTYPPRDDTTVIALKFSNNKGRSTHGS